MIIALNRDGERFNITFSLSEPLYSVPCGIIGGSGRVPYDYCSILNSYVGEPLHRNSLWTPAPPQTHAKPLKYAVGSQRVPLHLLADIRTISRLLDWLATHFPGAFSNVKCSRTRVVIDIETLSTLCIWTSTPSGDGRKKYRNNDD